MVIKLNVCFYSTYYKIFQDKPGVRPEVGWTDRGWNSSDYEKDSTSSNKKLLSSNYSRFVYIFLSLACAISLSIYICMPLRLSTSWIEVGTPRTMGRTPPPLIRSSLVQTTPGQCVYFPLSLSINVRMDLFGLWKGLYPPPMRNIMMQQLKVIKGNISLNIMYFPKVVQNRIIGGPRY